jgi:hypothetical protein
MPKLTIIEYQTYRACGLHTDIFIIDSRNYEVHIALNPTVGFEVRISYYHVIVKSLDGNLNSKSSASCNSTISY